MKRGDYEPYRQQKGVEEASFKGLKEGEVFWKISEGGGSHMDVKRQEDAEIISRLIKIEDTLRELLKKNL